MATGRVPTTANSPLTAKGDLFGYSTTQARVAVGNDGETLVADSSTSTGLRYTAGTVQANPVLNSAMQIAQRGTSISVAANTRAYTLDRWDSITNPNQASTVTRQATGDTTNLPNIQYALRFQRNSGQTGTGGIYVAQSFETVNSIPYAGKTVTFSFYARAGANYSAASSLLNASLATGTGTDQGILGGYTGTLTPISLNATLTTTWQRFTATAALSSSLNEMSVYFAFTPTGTAGVNDYFEVTGVQIDIGSVALPFRTYAGTIQGELAACQRYYWRATSTTTNNAKMVGYGNGTSTTNAFILLKNPVTMRVAPSVVDYSTLKLWNGNASASVSSVTIGDASNNENYAYLSFVTSTGLTDARPYGLYCDGNGAYIGFSAEL